MPVTFVPRWTATFTHVVRTRLHRRRKALRLLRTVLGLRYAPPRLRFTDVTALPPGSHCRTLQFFTFTLHALRARTRTTCHHQRRGCCVRGSFLRLFGSAVLVAVYSLHYGLRYAHLHYTPDAAHAHVRYRLRLLYVYLRFCGLLLLRFVRVALLPLRFCGCGWTALLLPAFAPPRGLLVRCHCALVAHAATNANPACVGSPTALKAGICGWTLLRAVWILRSLLRHHGLRLKRRTAARTVCISLPLPTSPAFGSVLVAGCVARRFCVRHFAWIRLYTCVLTCGSFYAVPQVYLPPTLHSTAFAGLW